MDGEILECRLISRRYHTDIYRVKWRGRITAEEMINCLDSGNYGGNMEYKPVGENLYCGTVTVYTD